MTITYIRQQKKYPILNIYLFIVANIPFIHSSLPQREKIEFHSFLFLYLRIFVFFHHNSLAYYSYLLRCHSIRYLQFLHIIWQISSIYMYVHVYFMTPSNSAQQTAGKEGKALELTRKTSNSSCLFVIIFIWSSSQTINSMC